MRNFAPVFATAIAVTAALAAVPVAADVVHRTTVDHEGARVSLSYEPRVATTLRQTGLGPKAAAACLWRTEVSVERKLADAAGRPVAALTRAVGPTKTSEGLVAGQCAHVTPRQAASFGGDEGKLRAFVAQAAEHDRQGLHADLASIGGFGRGTSR